MKKMKLNSTDDGSGDDSDDDDMPVLGYESTDGECDDKGGVKKPKTTSKSKSTTTTGKSMSNSKKDSSSVCSRPRPLREIAHRSERESHGRRLAPPPHSLSPHRRSEHAGLCRLAPVGAFCQRERLPPSTSALACM